METLLALLVSALSLKAAILGMPNLDAEFREYALKIADTAIVSAQASMEARTTVPEVVPAYVAPVQEPVAASTAVAAPVEQLAIVGTPVFTVMAWKDSGAAQTLMRVYVEATTTVPASSTLTIGSASQGSGTLATQHRVMSGDIVGGTYVYTITFSSGTESVSFSKQLHTCLPSNGDHLPEKPAYDSCTPGN